MSGHFRVLLLAVVLSCASTKTTRTNETQDVRSAFTAPLQSQAVDAETLANYEKYGAEGAYEIENVLAYRVEDDRYLIKWKGYPDSANSWEPKGILPVRYTAAWMYTSSREKSAAYESWLPPAETEAWEAEEELRHVEGPIKDHETGGLMDLVVFGACQALWAALLFCAVAQTVKISRTYIRGYHQGGLETPAPIAVATADPAIAHGKEDRDHQSYDLTPAPPPAADSRKNPAAATASARRVLFGDETASASLTLPV